MFPLPILSVTRNAIRVDNLLRCFTFDLFWFNELLQMLYIQIMRQVVSFRIHSRAYHWMPSVHSWFDQLLGSEAHIERRGYHTKIAKRSRRALARSGKAYVAETAVKRTANVEKRICRVIRGMGPATLFERRSK